MTDNTACGHGAINKRILKTESFERIENFGPKFGRMFPHLPPHQPGPSKSASPDELLGELGRANGPMLEKNKGKSVESTLPAGLTFVGQFIDHDITLDTTSKLGSQSDPSSLRNFRTPALDLDCLYGGGPDATPHLYRKGSKAMKGELYDPCNADLPRAPNLDGKPGNALIGDPRNDENVIVSQLQLSMLKFHNKVLHATEDFDEARKIVTFYYHRMILDDFLPAIIGKELTEDIKRNGPLYYQPTQHRLFMPVEFSVAAYRYGHTQVRADYQMTKSINAPLFKLGGFRPPALPSWNGIDWRYFFKGIKGSSGVPVQLGHKLDSKLPMVLLKLPDQIVDSKEKFRKSLASRNLQRGWTVGLPSGQAIANKMFADGVVKKTDVISHTTIKKDDTKTLGKMSETPLWYYILKEAEKKGKGNRLGPVGGRIVGEVLYGMMLGDVMPVCYGYQPNVHVHKKCKAEQCGIDGDKVTMADILNYTGYGTG